MKRQRALFDFCSHGSKLFCYRTEVTIVFKFSLSSLFLSQSWPTKSRFAKASRGEAPHWGHLQHAYKTPSCSSRASEMLNHPLRESKILARTLYITIGTDIWTSISWSLIESYTIIAFF